VSTNFVNITDIYGFSLPDLDLKAKDIPPQISSDIDAYLIDYFVPQALWAIASIMGANFAVNAFAHSGSFTPVWSLLNSAQILVHSLMFENLKTPANALMINKYMIKITSLNVVEISRWMNSSLFSYLPEAEAFSLSFSQYGFDSLLITVNVSFYLILYATHAGLFMFIFLPIWVASRFTGKCVWLKDTLASYFLWNGMIRIFMITFLDFFLAAFLNTSKGDWGTVNPTEEVSNRISI
jgi:hypothetical protein